MKKIAKLIGWYLNTLALLAPSTAGRKGFYLFCTPLAPPVKPHHHEFLNTAEKVVFEHEGTAIQTYRWGSGRRKILFLHGWQSHSFRWKNFIESFSKEYTVYALDAPAHGLSGGKYINLPVYSRLIEHFILKNPVDAVVSHSFGSFASLYALHNTPILPVGRLVIMGAPGEATDFIEFYRGQLGLSDRAMKVINDHFTEALRFAPDFFSAARFARTLSIPGLIVHDELDEETPYRHALEVHKVWKNSRLMTTNGLGHNLRSAELVDQVKAFVAGQEVQVPETASQAS